MKSVWTFGLVLGILFAAGFNNSAYASGGGKLIPVNSQEAADQWGGTARNWTLRGNMILYGNGPLIRLNVECWMKVDWAGPTKISSGSVVASTFTIWIIDSDDCLDKAGGYPPAHQPVASHPVQQQPVSVQVEPQAQPQVVAPPAAPPPPAGGPDACPASNDTIGRFVGGDANLWQSVGNGGYHYVGTETYMTAPMGAAVLQTNHGDLQPGQSTARPVAEATLWLDPAKCKIVAMTITPNLEISTRPQFAALKVVTLHDYRKTADPRAA